MDSQFNNTNTIKRYLRAEMGDQELLEFEFEMQKSQDLRLAVLLARERRNAIQAKVDLAIEQRDVQPRSGKKQNILYFKILKYIAAASILALVIKLAIPIHDPKVSNSSEITGNNNEQLDSGKSEPTTTVSDTTPKKGSEKKSEEKDKYKDQKELAMSGFKLLPITKGHLGGGGGTLDSLLLLAEQYYINNNMIGLKTVLLKDEKHPHLLRLAANLAMSQGDFELAINYWLQYRSIPYFEDEDTHNLARCYAAKFGTYNNQLKELANNSSDIKIKELYQLCQSK
jgi:hypothetical protein